MTILFVTHYSEMYGANKSLCRLMIELKESYQVQPVVLLRMPGSICETLDSKSIPYLINHYYWWVFEKGHSNLRVHEILKQIRNYFRLSKIVKKLQPYPIELVYTNSITVNIGTHLSKKLKCPQLWHLRESLVQFNLKFALSEVFAKYHFKTAADNYILISNYLLNSYEQLLPVEKVSKVYNGIVVEGETRTYNTVGDTIHLCVVGVVSEQKNQLEAVEALQILVKDYNIIKIHLHVVGVVKGNYYEKLMAFIEKYQLIDFVTFHGHVDNVDALLDGMNLGLNCARDEAFGRVTIEFMLHRMPVVASNSGANPELIEIGKNGELYSLHNSRELAEHILPFIDEPGLLERYGGYAQQYAIKHFSSERNTEAIYSIIKETLISK